MLNAQSNPYHDYLVGSWGLPLSILIPKLEIPLGVYFHSKEKPLTLDHFLFHFASTPPAKGTLTCSRILRITLCVEEAWEASSGKQQEVFIQGWSSVWYQKCWVERFSMIWNIFVKPLKHITISRYNPNWCRIMYIIDIGLETSSTRRNIIIVAIQSNWFTITCAAVGGACGRNTWGLVVA